VLRRRVPHGDTFSEGGLPSKSSALRRSSDLYDEVCGDALCPRANLAETKVRAFAGRTYAFGIKKIFAAARLTFALAKGRAMTVNHMHGLAAAFAISLGVT
jgi:hypothetical protein